VFKTLFAQIAVLFRERETRKNLKPFLGFLIFVFVVMLGFAGIFHFLMWAVEGQRHSWLSGFYWVLVTMSTLGFGDIVFTTDVGRFFSVVVILTGVVLLLIVLPFVFLNAIALPWVRASLRVRAPREVGPEMAGHVILAGEDSVALALSERLDAFGIPHVMLEPDAERAARLAEDRRAVMWGEVDALETWERAHVERARLVVANRDDVTNTNLILTVRDLSDTVPIVAIAASEDSVDVMELAGATHALPLRRQLGEQLAGRVNAGHAEVHEIGRVRDLVVAELPVHNTPLAGKTVRDTRLRELFGISIVGIWENAELRPVRPERILSDQCVPVIVGTEAQMTELNEVLYIYDTNWNPVIVMGGGTVGRAAIETLKKRGVPVHLVERNPEVARGLEGIADEVFIGDAAHRDLLEAAGIMQAPAVVLTTNDDATNVYLAVYCRRLNPDLRIISRVTHQRNVASIRRAGADLVLSYDALGVETLSALVRERPVVLLGEGVELLEVRTPKSIVGKSLAEAGIGARTGLNVVGIEAGEDEGATLLRSPGATTVLEANTRLILIGPAEGRVAFEEAFGSLDLR
jgi:voltage-gated potassium channel